MRAQAHDDLERADARQHPAMPPIPKPSPTPAPGTSAVRPRVLGAADADSRDVRASMGVFPEAMQPLLTIITGKPRPAERPIVRIHPLATLAFTLLFGVLTIAANIYAFERSVLLGVLLLPLTWIINTGTFRKTQVIYLHHLTHRTVTRGRRLNKILIDVVTTIGFIQNGDDYRNDHIPHHGPSVFTAPEDADAAFLLMVGFAPGTDKASLWSTLWRVIFSRRLHWNFFKSRIRSNFVTPPLYRRAMSVAWAACLVAAAVTTNWWAFALTVLVPMIPLYHISAMLQLLTEHAWFADTFPLSRAEYIDRCWGRFCGEPCPDPGLPAGRLVWAWARWGARMIFLHLPVRLAILMGDLPAHDWHHLAHLLGEDARHWPTGIFMRQMSIDRGDPIGFRTRELWGLPAMVDHVFFRISLEKPLAARFAPP